MFHNARLKLTAWYLLIIFLISLVFSLIIYQVLTQEVDRFTRLQRSRIEHRVQLGEFMPLNCLSGRCPAPFNAYLDSDLITEIKRRIIFSLITIDSAILILSGVLGYVLAGRTLDPIRAMVDDQNHFISEASHQLRTPLTSLKSALEVHIRDTHLTLKDAKSLLKTNIEDVNQLQSLSDSLLQLAQYHKPNGHSEFAKVRVDEVITRAIKKLTPLSRGKEIKIVFSSHPITIQIDEDGLSQLLQILLDNSIKYSPPNSTITLTALTRERSCTIEVKDEGIGLKDGDLPHLFDRFYRGENRLDHPTPGYGLGLSIAKRIAELHHGTITARNNPTGGAIFTVRLPMKHPESV